MQYIEWSYLHIHTHIYRSQTTKRERDIQTKYYNMIKSSSYTICVMLLLLFLVVSPLHVLSYGGAPSFEQHPNIMLHNSGSQIAKNKMLKESDDEFTKQLFGEFDIDV